MSTENKKHWYTLHVYSSMEKSVKHALEERIAQSGPLREKFGAVLLPIEKVHEILSLGYQKSSSWGTTIR